MKPMQTEDIRKLTPEQQSFYGENGYFFPVRVLDPEKAAEYQGRFMDYSASHAEQLKGLLQRDRRVYMTDTHLFLEWVYRLVSLPSILDAVESVLGPNLLVWGAQFFPKLPGDHAYVSWHQDGTYWGLKPPNVTTAWLALSESNTQNGCMRVVPGTQKTPKLPQRETYAANNMLSRGQEIAVEVDEARAEDLVLKPGEISLHHIGIVHGSGPNQSTGPRIGLAIRYIAPEVKQEGPTRDIAVLVRGKDEYGHFDLAEPPQRDLSPEQSPTHVEALRRKAANTLPASAPKTK
jgi:non-haem Fe2+, alpha-ketoglutarate-dependent halogenase